MAIPYKEIMKLALTPGAKSIAVENFLTSIDRTMPVFFHLQNLAADARSYRWNAATVTAIKAGLKVIYTGDF